MTFKDSLKTKDFVVTAHLNMADVSDPSTLLKQAAILKSAVDGVQVTDSIQEPIGGIATAALLIQQGIDPIVHMNCRDRNRIALEKDFMGATALGVTSVLIRRGTKILKSPKVGIKNVFDTTALEFMAYINSLKEDTNSSVVSDFHIGANAEIFEPDLNWVPKNLIRKCEAGSNFIQLQICFDMEVLRKYMSQIVASKLTHSVNFIVSLSPLPSADVARWMRDNIKGALVPDFVIERMDQASNPESEGVKICAEMLRESRTIPGISGANLLTMGKLEDIPAAIDASGVRTN